jgi:hypothetical protein
MGGLVAAGSDVIVGDGDAMGVDVGSAVGDGASGDGAPVADAAGSAVAVRAVAGGGVTVGVAVAVGSTAATIPCSCMPRARASPRVRITRAAAISPPHSGPNPLVAASNRLAESNPFPAPELILPQHHLLTSLLGPRPAVAQRLLPAMNAPPRCSRAGRD